MERGARTQAGQDPMKIEIDPVMPGAAVVHADIAPHNERARRGWVRVTGGEARTLPLAG